MGPPKRCLLSFQSKSQVSVTIPDLMLCVFRGGRLSIFSSLPWSWLWWWPGRSSPQVTCAPYTGKALSTRGITPHGTGMGQVSGWCCEKRMWEPADAWFPRDREWRFRQISNPNHLCLVLGCGTIHGQFLKNMQCPHGVLSYHVAGAN